jgi:DNA-binding response OmpR family regulator
MRESWIYGDGAAALEAASMVAELGFSPRRMGARDSVGSAMASPNASYPEVVLIVVGDTLSCPPTHRLLRDLRSDPELCEVPLIVVMDAPVEGALIACDEVILQPLRIEELGVRIARARSRHGIVAQDLIRLGSLDIDLAAYEVRLHDEPLVLTHMEYRLLELLATHPRRVYSRERLLSRMWGNDHDAGARAVDGHVGRLRAKLGPEHGHRICTVRNVGYRFEP